MIYGCCREYWGKTAGVTDIPCCPYLTHLSVSEPDSHAEALFSIIKAMKAGHLPRLSHLSLARYRSELMEIFQSKLPGITQLNLHHCFLNNRSMSPSCPEEFASALSTFTFTGHFYAGSLDISSFFQLSSRSLKSLVIDIVDFRYYDCLMSKIKQREFVSLRTLRVSCRYGKPRGIIEWFDPIHMPHLGKLTLRRVLDDQQELKDLMTIISRLNLVKLDISHSTKGMKTMRSISGGLCALLHYDFPTLQVLILSDCGLSPDDLSSLAQASAEGRLPELKHLDISKNDSVSGNLGELFSFNCNWDKLQHLDRVVKRIRDVLPCNRCLFEHRKAHWFTSRT